MGKRFTAFNIMWKYAEQKGFGLSPEQHMMRLDYAAAVRPPPPPHTHTFRLSPPQPSAAALSHTARSRADGGGRDGEAQLCQPAAQPPGHAAPCPPPPHLARPCAVLCSGPQALRAWGMVDTVQTQLAVLKERPRVGKAVSIILDVPEEKVKEWVG